MNQKTLRAVAGIGALLAGNQSDPLEQAAQAARERAVQAARERAATDRPGVSFLAEAERSARQIYPTDQDLQVAGLADFFRNKGT